MSIAEAGVLCRLVRLEAGADSRARLERHGDFPEHAPERSVLPTWGVSPVTTISMFGRVRVRSMPESVTFPPDTRSLPTPSPAADRTRRDVATQAARAKVVVARRQLLSFCSAQPEVANVSARSGRRRAGVKSVLVAGMSRTRASISRGTRPTSRLWSRRHSRSVVRSCRGACSGKLAVAVRGVPRISSGLSSHEPAETPASRCSCATVCYMKGLARMFAGNAWRAGVETEPERVISRGSLRASASV